MLKRTRWAAVLVTSIALAAVATAAPATAAKAKPPKLSGSITVSAAASLTEAFTKMGTDFQKINKGTAVTFNYAASSTLAQQIQFIFIQTPFESQKEPIIAVPRIVDRFLVDQKGIDHATDLDQLLPVTAVPGKSRQLSGSNCSDLAQTYFGHHAFKTCS